MKHTMKGSILVASILVILLSCLACKMTPEDGAVINKNDSALVSKIEHEVEDATEYDAPEKLMEDIDVNDTTNISIQIAANVEVPDTNRFPVVKVKPKEITQQMADEMLVKFIGENDLYGYNQIATKQDIEQEILKTKETLSNPESNFNEAYKKGTDEYEEAKAGIEADIRFLEKQYANAPEQIQMEMASRMFGEPTFTDEVQADYVVIEGYTKKEGQTDLEVLIQKNAAPPYFKEYVQVASFLRSPIMGQYPLQDSLKNTNISYAAAKELADNYMEKLGIGDYGLTLSCIADQIDSMKIAYEPKEDWLQSYVFHYTPLVNNIPLTYNKFSFLSDQAYNHTWEQEYVKITVDDLGVTSFSWICPMEQTETINENVELLPFEEIQEIIRKNMVLNMNYYDADPEIIGRKIQIDRIVLGYTKVRVQDSEEFMLVPSWSLFGSEINKYDGQPEGGFIVDENNEYKQDAVGQSYLVINAIDGSVINFSQGY